MSLGLAHLHDEGIVHGDLHGGNILINSNKQAVLTDFGLSVIAQAVPHEFLSKHGGGAEMWKAPELFYHTEFGLPTNRPTVHSDIYSFACTCVEVRVRCRT